MSLISSATSAYGTLASLSYVNQTNKNQATGQVQTTESSTASAVDQDSDQAKVSSFGQMMSTLQQLANTDQDVFKSTAQTISANLAQSASEATDPMQKEAFSELSAKFDEAAKSGDMSSLKDIGQGPPPGISGTSGSAGGDKVTISTEGRDLASQDGNSGSGTSSENNDSAGSETSENASGASSQKTSGKSGAAGAAGSGESSSSSGRTVDDIEKDIEKLKQNIQKQQVKLQQAQQMATKDESKMDEVKSMTVELSSLNTQLSELQSEKLQTESSSSSSSSSGAASGGGASMTTHS